MSGGYLIYDIALLFVVIKEPELLFSMEIVCQQFKYNIHT